MTLSKGEEEEEKKNREHIFNILCLKFSKSTQRIVQITSDIEYLKKLCFSII
jgi:hypothetical protein